MQFSVEFDFLILHVELRRVDDVLIVVVLVRSGSSIVAELVGLDTQAGLIYCQHGLEAVEDAPSVDFRGDCVANLALRDNEGDRRPRGRH